MLCQWMDRPTEISEGGLNLILEAIYTEHN